MRCDANANAAAPLSQAQLQQQREVETQGQEEALDNILGGVIGLKNHAINIDSEVVTQNVMLDEFGEEIELTTEELKKQTEKARKLNSAKSKKCKLCCCILVLFIIQIVLLSI